MPPEDDLEVGLPRSIMLTSIGEKILKDVPISSMEGDAEGDEELGIYKWAEDHEDRGFIE